MNQDDVRDAPRTRAPSMSADDRKAMIVDAVIPLLLEHGRGMTSRQIAEAAGIAEGTIFRAFGDKETLVQAAIEKYLDPEPLREALRSIDPALPLEHKVRAILYLLRERFQSVMRIMPVIGPQRPPVPQERGEFARIIARIMEPQSDDLNWPPERVAHVLRLISFSAAFPALNEGIEFSIDDLARMVLVGVAGESPYVADLHHPIPTSSTSSTTEA
ncbi:TetR/AcrR family transcriptional regulator [Leifsonia shinshuensis]|uniref:TetR/AcrR family transcriptional regulator n=1 Tax=Leifsonia shinshuensis TaxID=150026 RepID=UPI002858E60D|nr:TetR/AcrR family transcriptional regulator [Leifsonia shinshuensis]MDR6969928.1 AcrR family transcriptional regulator [Leifsonia shinshuensis]